MNILSKLSGALLLLVSTAAISNSLPVSPYQPFAQENGTHSALNIIHNWQIDFQTSGTTLLRPLSRKHDYHIGIKLQQVNHQYFTSPRRQSREDHKLTYHWDDNFTEWWINTEQGIEQWFKIKRPIAPQTSLSNAKPASGIILQLELSSSLAFSQQGNSLLFTDPDGKHITYKKLLAWDAQGRILPSNMQLSGNTLKLHIDDKDASYPIIIDPSFAGEAYIEGANFKVAVSGDTLVVGDPFKDSPPYTNYQNGIVNSPSQNTGIVHVYTRSGPQPVREWTLQQSFEPVLTDDNHNNIYFGFRVAIDGDVMAIGNRIYTRTGNTWTERTQLTPIGGTLGLTDHVAISGNTIVIGAGYIFNRVGNAYSWSNQVQLIPDTTGGVAVTGPLAIDGNTVIIGDENEGGDANSSSASPNNLAPEAGAAYVFAGSGNTWSQQAYLKTGNPTPGDHFGFSVSISGDSVIVGAPETDETGLAFIFSRSGQSWSQQAVLNASNSITDGEPFQGDLFGYSVSIDADTAVVGAPQEDGRGGTYGDDDNSSRNAGGAYVFSRMGSSWSQINYLKEDQVDGLPAANGTNKSYPANHEYFGFSVDIAGEIIAAGTFLEYPLSQANGYSTDAVSVFIRRYKIDVDVTGLPTGGSLHVLNSFTGDDVVVTSNGLMTMPTYLQNGRNYAITLSDTPTNPNYTCQVFDGTGFLQGSDISIDVKCNIDMHQLNGTISGLGGAGLVLQNNGGQSIALSSSATSFQFPLQPDGSDYFISVANQPNGQFCSVNGGWGSISGADVSNVQVICHQNRHAIKGSISGLLTTLQLINQDTGETISLTNSNSDFVFQDQAENSYYHISVSVSPSNPSQTCSFTGSAQGIIQGDVFLELVCVVDSFRVRAKVYNMSMDSLGNLTPFSGLVVQNNGGNDLAVNNGGVISQDFYFPFQLDETSYAITVLTQPMGFNCRATDGADSSSGVFSGQDVTVNVRCFLSY